MKSLLFVLAFALTLTTFPNTAYSGFGGSRSSGSRSYSSSSRSSSSFGGFRSSATTNTYSSKSTFGGSRASTNSATIIRKTPQVSSVGVGSTTNVVRETTVIHHDSGMGWLPWMMFWHQPTVVVQPQQVVVDQNGQPVQQMPQVQQVPPQPSYWWVWAILIAVGSIVGLYFLTRTPKQRYA